ncbi:bleomycin resistance protein [Aliiroseovarius sp. YM-037]|uniref:bleomycin resistance protein n=1 Tax=Aliiroseovarius sp. YM-037 TaxID=3341728 RepID=UPI003A8103AB
MIIRWIERDWFACRQHRIAARKGKRMLKSICPIFPSRDFDTTAGFYENLGFQEVSRYEAEGYLILVRAAVEVHFFRCPGHNPASSDHGAFVRVDDATALSKRFEPKNLPGMGIPRFEKAEDKPWGICELAIIDPDGNLLRMGHIMEA